MFLNMLDRIDSTRQKVLNGLNRRYIYGRLVCFSHPLLPLASLLMMNMAQPLLHTLLFLIEMLVTMRLVAKFNSYYADKPGMDILFPIDWMKHG
jgi:hypothetical protein